jgi:guanosine-3',5'-bis(diphosphate) 3'-pyrophosphohydrolase
MKENPAPAGDVGLIIKALAFAAHKHRDQRRKDVNASPYINHPISLADLLYQKGGVDDVVVIVGALLHDTIEDTDTTPAELTVEFGSEISGVVLEVTDDTNLDRATRKQVQIERAAQGSDKAKLIRLADKICNLQDMLTQPPASWDLDRKQEYFDWAKRVVDQIRGTNSKLEAIFDDTYSRRPEV